jgi:hypothetical protein
MVDNRFGCMGYPSRGPDLTYLRSSSPDRPVLMMSLKLPATTEESLACTHERSFSLRLYSPTIPALVSF